MWRMSVITEMRILASSDAQIVIFNARNRSKGLKVDFKNCFQISLGPQIWRECPLF